MDLNDVKAGDYQLVAELFDQPLSKPEDKVFRFKRYRRGQVVTLDEEEAKRLVSAGAVVEPGSLEQAAVEQARAAYEAALALLPPKPEEIAAEEVSDEQKSVSEMTLDELTAYAAVQSIDIGRATTEDGIRAKITEAKQV